MSTSSNEIDSGCVSSILLVSAVSLIESMPDFMESIPFEAVSLILLTAFATSPTVSIVASEAVIYILF